MTTLCYCGDEQAIHVSGFGECAMCSCQRFAARTVDTVTTPPKPRWLQRLSARDETGKVLGGIL